MEKQIIKSKINELKAIFSENEKLSKQQRKWIAIERECCNKLGHVRCVDCKFIKKCSVVANNIKYGDLIGEKMDASAPIIMELYPYIKTIKKNEYVKCINMGMKYANRYSSETKMINKNSICIGENCITCGNNIECVAYNTHFPKVLFDIFLYGKMKYLIDEYPEIIENL